MSSQRFLAYSSSRIGKLTLLEELRRDGSHGFHRSKKLAQVNDASCLMRVCL
jgi:hypothetical protein